MSRGRASDQTASVYLLDQEALIPRNHPLRAIKKMVDQELRELQPILDGAYARQGRASIPPERLLKAMLLMALFSVRSERQLCEQLGYNFLYRWFLDMNPDEPAFDATSFTKNRKRFAEHGITRAFFELVVALGIESGYASDEHFSVDGTLIASYASLKSVRPIDGDDEQVRDGSDDDDPGNPSIDFRGQRRTNTTHRSLTDPEARFARKSNFGATSLAHSGHALMENRNGLVVDIEVDAADGHAERRCALQMVARARERLGVHLSTLGADRGYDDGAFMAALAQANVTAHIAMRDRKISLQDANGRLRLNNRLRQRGKPYQLSQRIRKRIEEAFAWTKGFGGLRRARHAGRWKLRQCMEMIAAAYNLLRMVKLAASPT